MDDVALLARLVHFSSIQNLGDAAFRAADIIAATGSHITADAMAASSRGIAPGTPHTHTSPEQTSQRTRATRLL
jgi:hypothetical protein